ncbi:hypothetical protein B0H19DRAFT_1069347 [Mycena capillaripes]|nr:hypothetical protein B0H19DRAFT_1069347 [Mycena capillaripes]
MGQRTRRGKADEEKRWTIGSNGERVESRRPLKRVLCARGRPGASRECARPRGGADILRTDIISGVGEREVEAAAGIRKAAPRATQGNEGGGVEEEKGEARPRMEKLVLDRSQIVKSIHERQKESAGGEQRKITAARAWGRKEWIVVAGARSICESGQSGHEDFSCVIIAAEERRT